MNYSEPLQAADLDVQQIRQLFPIFVREPDKLYFDSAATTQKPASVIDTAVDFYRKNCANSGRGNYLASILAAEAIQTTRRRMADFINADSADVVFTSGATESLNTVALAWGLLNLQNGDEVMVCPEDHRSTVLPWINLKDLLASFGVNIKIVPFAMTKDGEYDRASIKQLVTTKTRLLALTHVHHLYGTDVDVAAIRRLIGPNALISLDASQSISHLKVDVAKLGADFLSFSGHKMFALDGVGVLWAHPGIQAQLHSVKKGGHGTQQQPVNSLPDLLEAGTQNTASIISLGAAIDFIESIGIERIHRHVATLSLYLEESLKKLPGIEFIPEYWSDDCPRDNGIVSFRFEQNSTSDLAFVLDSENIQVRTGEICQNKRRDNGDEYMRASLHVYNTQAEVDRFIALLRENLF